MKDGNRISAKTAVEAVGQVSRDVSEGDLGLVVELEGYDW